MKTPYEILEIPPNASFDEIKKAFKVAAKKYHPDVNPDDPHAESKFQEINTAYQSLTNAPLQPSVHVIDFNQIFRDFYRPHNRNIQINLEITLQENINGAEKWVNVSYGAGNTKMVRLNIPPGVPNYHVMKFDGMGDTAIPNAPPGDLYARIIYAPELQFQHHGFNLYYELKLNAFELLAGAVISIKSITCKDLTVIIPPKSWTGDVIEISDEGLYNFQTKHRHSLYINLVAAKPEVTDEQIKKIKNWVVT